jgi:hypothetical protein
MKSIVMPLNSVQMVPEHGSYSLQSLNNGWPINSELFGVLETVGCALIDIQRPY